jgi:signal transduction histidine kinase
MTKQSVMKRNNPLGLAEDRILVEQLRLLMGNVGSSVIPAILLAIMVLWVLFNDANAVNLQIWCVAVVLSKLLCYLHARYHLAHGIRPGQMRRLVGELIILNALDGGIWASLAWATLDTSTMAGSSLVFAVITGVAGSSMSLLSPVLPVFVAFLVTEMVVTVSKLFLMGDVAYDAIGMAGVLYVITLIGQARNSARAARAVIDLRFDLADSHARLREIEQHQILAQERQRLMQDMHDGLGSSLVSALRVVEHGRLDEEEVAHVLKSCIDDLKLAIDSLEPVDADLLLLLATLRFRLGPRLESTGIALRWEVQAVPALDWLAPNSALHILRILQEAITNIVKHAQATEIRIATGVEANWVRVVITDNGRGFDVPQGLKNSGKGLGNQLRRAESIGAEIELLSSAAGTCLTLRLPIKADN